jgi:hypothetical protein
MQADHVDADPAPLSPRLHVDQRISRETDADSASEVLGALEGDFELNGWGDGNPSGTAGGDATMRSRGQGDPRNPGVRFGYWASKEYFMKNIGHVKDYRTARQLLLDAESAMLKTIEAEKWKTKWNAQEYSKERQALKAEITDKEAIIRRLLVEKEVNGVFDVPCRTSAAIRELFLAAIVRGV